MILAVFFFFFFCWRQRSSQPFVVAEGFIIEVRQRRWEIDKFWPRAGVCPGGALADVQHSAAGRAGQVGEGPGEPLPPP